MATTKRRKNKGYYRLTAALLSGTMAITSCLIGADLTSAAGSGDTELQNPRVEMNTCDTVYFGNYWQEDTNGDGVADQNDEKTPIRWRILSRNGNDAYVMADQVLDCKKYHEIDESVTWETSTLRKWLNGEFYNTAFTVEEQEAVLEQTLENVDNEKYATENEEDMVYLPSYDDVVNDDYGFLGDQARIGKNTAYAMASGGEANSWWWIFPSGSSTAESAAVNPNGDVMGYGAHSAYRCIYGVRPALHLDLSSPFVRISDPVEIFLERSTWDLVKLGSYEGKPITWRVLWISGEEVFLLSDQILTDREYHGTDESIIWQESALRAWLNGTFYEEVFSGQEKGGILSKEYTNSDNPVYGTQGGEDTRDMVVLLSLEDIVNPEYGFPTVYSCRHQTRTAYDSEGRTEENDRSGSWWWLRSPGFNSGLVAVVDSSGDVTVKGYDAFYGDILVANSKGGVRPALHFDISKYPLTKVGTVTAEAEKEYREDASGRPIGTEKPGTTEEPNATHQPETTGKPEPSSKPDTTNPPSSSNPPENTQTPSDVMPTVTPSGSVSTGSSGTNGTSSVSGSSQGSVKNQPTKLNIKNKKKYPLSKKLTIRDADGIHSVKLNGKIIKIKAGKKSISFKLSKYKKKLKKGKWNRLVITDQKGRKKTIKFKIK